MSLGNSDCFCCLPVTIDNTGACGHDETASERFRDKELIIKRYINSSIDLLYFRSQVAREGVRYSPIYGPLLTTFKH